MSKSDEPTASGCLAALIGILVILPLQVMVMTWVFTRFWLWFVVPLHLPNLQFWHAFGLATFIKMATFHGNFKSSSNKKEDESTWKEILVPAVAYFVYYGATYFLGWLAHQNMG